MLGWLHSFSVLYIHVMLRTYMYINIYVLQVIVALSEKNRSHIPYRNSMMTLMLRDRYEIILLCCMIQMQWNHHADPISNVHLHVHNCYMYTLFFPQSRRKLYDHNDCYLLCGKEIHGCKGEYVHYLLNAFLCHCSLT